MLIWLKIKKADLTFFPPHSTLHSGQHGWVILNDSRSHSRWKFIDRCWKSVCLTRLVNTPCFHVGNRGCVPFWRDEPYAWHVRSRLSTRGKVKWWRGKAFFKMIVLEGNDQMALLSPRQGSFRIFTVKRVAVRGNRGDSCVQKRTHP